MEGSKDMQRRQKISNESCPDSEAVKPQEYGEAPSMHSAPAKTDHRERQYHLMEEILAKDNMVAALAKVEANKGASGVDGMEVPDLRKNLKREWQFTKSILASGTYIPMPVRQVNIPKPDGGVRTLGIPTAVDRMIQQAICQKLVPIFDKDFSESSYGFRPARSAHQAVAKAREYIEEGYMWVVDIDIEKFFDNVNHDMLMARVAGKVKDKRVLKLIRAYLNAGVMENGVVVEKHEGTPQGGPLSPLLSNILLDDLDRELERRGHRFCRYADDCNIYLKSERAAERTYESIVRFIEGKLKLKVNRKKSKVDKADRRKFLGYSFYTPQKGTVRLRLGPGVAKRQKDKIRQITKRSRSRSLDSVISEINTAMIGFINYFKMADMKSFLSELEKWIRRKLRVIIWKQWKNCRTRFRKLLGMGLSPRDAEVAYSRRIYWRVSKTVQVNGIMGIAYFRKKGLIDMLEWYGAVR